VAWTASGLYAAVANLNLAGVTGPPWTLTTNKFFLTGSGDTPVYSQAAASAIYASTNEVNGTGWAAGGVACSALGAGSTSIAPALAVSAGPPTVISYTAGNISVSGTTLSGAIGGYFYWAAGGTQYKIMGIWFGGSAYTTTAGTFGITWSTSIATITCASTT
jgi:hypothetical protein